jgi:ribonuclease HI
MLWIHFPASNNAAEYEACLHGLRIATELGIKRLMVYGDFALVINQLNKDWSCTSKKMDAYYAQIKKLEGKFYGIVYLHIPQDQNQEANKLSKLGSSRGQVPAGVFVQDLMTPSIVEEDPVEMTPLDVQLVMAVSQPTPD